MELNVLMPGTKTLERTQGRIKPVAQRKEDKPKNGTQRKKVQLNDAYLIYHHLGYVAAFNAAATDRLHRNQTDVTVRILGHCRL